MTWPVRLRRVVFISAGALCLFFHVFEAAACTADRGPENLGTIIESID